MLPQPEFTKSAPRYEEIGHRVQRIIADPRVQKIQWVIVGRLPGEGIEDWDRLVDEIAETAGVRVDAQGDGSIRIGWGGYFDA